MIGNRRYRRRQPHPDQNVAEGGYATGVESKFCDGCGLSEMRYWPEFHRIHVFSHLSSGHEAQRAAGDRLHRCRIDVDFSRALIIHVLYQHFIFAASRLCAAGAQGKQPTSGSHFYNYQNDWPGRAPGGARWRLRGARRCANGDGWSGVAHKMNPSQAVLGQVQRSCKWSASFHLSDSDQLCHDLRGTQSDKGRPRDFTDQQTRSSRLRARRSRQPGAS